MTTDLNAMNKAAFENFCQCVDNAPVGTYLDAKELRTTIGDTADTLMKDVRELGLQANNCDLIYAVEVAIYDYVKQSNPDSNLFALAEGFGSSMNSPARERVLAQTARDMAQLRELGVVA